MVAAKPLSHYKSDKAPYPGPLVAGLGGRAAPVG